MKRLSLVLRLGAACAAVSIAAVAIPLRANPGGAGSARFQLVETDIATIQKALQTRLLTTEQLVQMYLNRIAAYDSPSACQ